MSGEDIQIKLISQTKKYCIFHPYTTCSGEHNDDDNNNDEYVSKIVENSEKLDNDIFIGKIIQNKISQYVSFFSPVLDKSPIQLTELYKQNTDGDGRGEIDAGKYKGCSLIEKTKVSEIDNFYSTKMRNLSFDGDILLYINKLKSADCPLHVLQKNISFCYYYLLTSVELLLKSNIIHFAIKIPNILYDLNQHVPILTNFKHAFNVADIQSAAGAAVAEAETSSGLDNMPQPVAKINYEFSAGFMNTLMRIFYDNNSSKNGYNHIDIVVLSYYIRYYIKDNKQMAEYAGFSPIINAEIIKEIIENYMTLLFNKLQNMAGGGAGGDGGDSGGSHNAVYKNIQNYFGIDTNDIANSKYFLFISGYVGKHWNYLFKDMVAGMHYEKWDKYSVYISFVDLSWRVDVEPTFFTLFM